MAGEMLALRARQFLAIHDQLASVAPQGGIKSAMIDLLSLSYSLQMYWFGIAHERAMRTHHAQRDRVQQYELN